MMAKAKRRDPGQDSARGLRAWIKGYAQRRQHRPILDQIEEQARWVADRSLPLIDWSERGEGPRAVDRLRLDKIEICGKSVLAEIDALQKAKADGDVDLALDAMLRIMHEFTELHAECSTAVFLRGYWWRDLSPNLRVVAEALQQGECSKSRSWPGQLELPQEIARLRRTIDGRLVIPRAERGRYRVELEPRLAAFLAKHRPPDM
jgi:hypothetical protein